MDGGDLRQLVRPKQSGPLRPPRLTGQPGRHRGAQGIAPALVITAALDLLRAEGALYADRLRRAGALVEHHDVPEADHGYDGEDDAKARAVYSLIARHLYRVTAPEVPKAP